MHFIFGTQPGISRGNVFVSPEVLINRKGGGLYGHEKKNVFFFRFGFSFFLACLTQHLPGGTKTVSPSGTDFPVL
jgi:hypothetical protein